MIYKYRKYLLRYPVESATVTWVDSYAAQLELQSVDLIKALLGACRVAVDSGDPNLILGLLGIRVGNSDVSAVASPTLVQPLDDPMVQNALAWFGMQSDGER
jgi:hypothetical protein